MKTNLMIFQVYIYYIEIEFYANKNYLIVYMMMLAKQSNVKDIYCSTFVKASNDGRKSRMSTVCGVF